MTKDRPQVRNRSRVVVVEGVSFDGPCKIEVQREEWISQVSNRYFTVWSARQQGRLGWEAARDPRGAIRRAAYVPDGERPRWLTAATKAVREAFA